MYFLQYVASIGDAFSIPYGRRVGKFLDV